MSYDVVNGELQPKKPPQLLLTGQQMAALVLMERRIAELNNDAKALGQLGADSLGAEVVKVTEVLSTAHQAYLAETQRTVKLASPGEVPKLVTG